jgi:hypothetical protein
MSNQEHPTDELTALRARITELERECDELRAALAEEVRVSRARKQAADNQEQMLSSAEAALTSATAQDQQDESPLLGAEMILSERRRAVTVEGWTPEHDDQHTNGELAWAAVCYAAPGCVGKPNGSNGGFGLSFVDPWPNRWDKSWDKRKKHDRIKQLVIAGQFIAAEIDRLKRAALTAAAPQDVPKSGPGVNDYTKVIDAVAKQQQAAPQAEPPDDARTYPCTKCGKLRSKAEGGTTFTVCDDCWDAAQDGQEGGQSC